MERPADALTLTDGQAHQVMIASDQILLASGTAALEAMLAKRPMVVAYKIAPLTHFIVKKLGILKVDRYSLPNVLAGEPIVPELMQHDCCEDRIGHEGADRQPGHVDRAAPALRSDPSRTSPERRDIGRAVCTRTCRRTAPLIAQSDTVPITGLQAVHASATKSTIPAPKFRS